MYGHHHGPSSSQVPNPIISPASPSSSSISANGSSSSAAAATAKYEDVAQSSDLFWEKLRAFHYSFGTKFIIPTIGGKALDLHRLFVEVTSHGGLEKILKDRKWKEVIVVFNFPSTITSASFVLRKYYQSLLYQFEQVYYFHKQVPSISTDDPLSRNHANELGIAIEGTIRNHFPGQGSVMHNICAATLELHPGSTVNGAIDGKLLSHHGSLGFRTHLDPSEIEWLQFLLCRALCEAKTFVLWAREGHQQRQLGSSGLILPKRKNNFIKTKGWETRRDTRMKCWNTNLRITRRLFTHLLIVGVCIGNPFLGILLAVHCVFLWFYCFYLT